MIKHRERVFHMTSQTHGQTGVEVFVFNCGTHYSSDNLVIGNKIDRLQGKRLEFYGIMFVFRPMW